MTERVYLEVIPIVGMGGIGKTALAQQVYNDARFANYLKAWACVSNNFDVHTITKKILDTIGKNLFCEGKDLDWLHDKLKEHLAGKKFLVVLDDVWNEDYEKWTTLLKPFQSGAKGSKIIVTTRNLRVAEIAYAQPYKLKELPRDACMTLFAFHALNVKNFDHHPNLEVLGMKIVEKCQGLPLAVKTLAGLLRFKDDAHEWQAVLDSKIWDLSGESNGILPALKLSYLHLPLNLRRCFAYCAIFPHGYEIARDELIHWWIAEGLLEGKKEKNYWNVGLKYFNMLVSRSLLQKSSSSESQFLMHDLVNDLAKVVAGATHFSSGEFELECDQNSPSSARHASFISSYCAVPEKFKIYHGMKGLRSFISLVKQSSFYGRSYVSKKVLCDLLSRLKYLRVLSLCRYHIKEVPDCIGKLRHLRYLNLSYTNIETLPKSIIALYNLEALILRGCQNLTELPKGMENLINLKFLDFTDTPNLRAMPLDIGDLVGLEMLSKFVVGTEIGSRLKELKNLNNLGRELCISDLHKVQDAGDAAEADLHIKEGICSLTMQWCVDFENFRNEELETQVLELLCPHQNLENLTISYYGGLEFSKWLESPSYVNIVLLCLHRCCKAKALPSLGQLSSLKILYIEGLNAIRTVGSEFYGTKSPFPSLMALEFKDMPLWEEWSHGIGIEEIGVFFPCLEHLVIRDCPMLTRRLPSQLSSLRKLEINSCPRMDALSSITSLPSLNELNFGGCNEGLLKSLVNLTSLTALVIQDVAELTCLNHEFTSSLIKLEKLEMESCKNLMYLWQDGDVIRNLNRLKSIVIKSCPQFISFTDGEGDIELPTTMVSINIKDCKMLLSLPRGLSVQLDESSSSSNNHGVMTSCLQELRISGCDSLQAYSFSKGQFFPTTLRILEIMSCRGVDSLAEILVGSLQSIQEIKISECINLRSLSQGLHTLSQLTSLSLTDCPAFELECFPSLPPSISRLKLWNCLKVKSLPNQLHRLTCLRVVVIVGCDSIERFPEGGLPLLLQTLVVRGCKNMKQPVRGWLTPLTSLHQLYIDGSVGGVGEEEDLLLLLPSSLRSLCIRDMEKVERLSNSLPSSLLSLKIFNCPKLREFPQDGLPSSLKYLHIKGCGILEEQCRKETGCHWPLICEIPMVFLGLKEGTRSGEAVESIT